jgi:hypothetical protein
MLSAFVSGMNNPPPPTGTSGQPAVDAEFERARPILEQRARDIYRVFAAGSLLSPSVVEVTLTVDRDILFHYSYPRPTSGPLLFEGVYLSRMPANHIDNLEVFDQSGQSLGSAELTAQKPSLLVTLPVAASLSEKITHMVLAGLVLVLVIFGIFHFSRRAPGESS